MSESPAGSRAATGGRCANAAALQGEELSRILHLEVPVIVVLAERQMSLKAILEMTVGTIIEFDVPFDAELSLNVADQTIGHGQAVKVGENFGVRIGQIGSVSERIDAMGPD